MASGSVKGFALTLTIGLIASMFSAILGTRVLFRWGIDTGMLRKLSFLNLIKSVRLRFRRKSTQDLRSNFGNPASQSPSEPLAVRNRRLL